jgi:uridine kinase
MAIRVGPEDVVKRLGQVPRPSLIAIDGLPCSGKSTGAEAIQAAHGFACVYLDGFVRAEAEWPATRKPAFPFEFIRYDEFVQAVRALKVTGQCTYAPFDWQTLSIATVTRTVTLATPVIVEAYRR